MKEKISLISFILFILIISCTQPDKNTIKGPQHFSYTSSPFKTGFDEERLAIIDTVLISLVNNGIIPNVETFVARNGTVVYHKVFGYRNLEDSTELQLNDIFRIASQTKAITSVALMTLYEKGMFVLDDNIAKYIPEFKNPEVLVKFNEEDTTYITRPANTQITIRHLLTHTSGIHYGILGGGIGGMMFAKENIPAVNSLDSVTIEQVVKKIAQMPLLHEPGENFTYGMNTDVLAYLIEILSGKTFDVFLQETIFNPLGMNDTYFYLPEEKRSCLVTLYSLTANGLVYHNNKSYQTFPYAGAQTFLSGGAGLCGSIEDYAKFCQMMLNGGSFNGKRILGRKTVEIMTMNQAGNNRVSWSNNKFGLGFEIIDEETTAHHLWSEGAYKWGGMYYTDYLIDPKEKMIMLVYTNVHPYNGPKMHEIFHNMVYQALK